MTVTLELSPYSWFTMRQAFKHCDELLGWEDGECPEMRDMAWGSVAHFGGGTALHVIDEDRLARYATHLRDYRGDGATTINRKLSALSVLMDCAAIAGKLAGRLPNFPWQEEGQQ